MYNTAYIYFAYLDMNLDAQPTWWIFKLEAAPLSHRNYYSRRMSEKTSKNARRKKTPKQTTLFSRAFFSPRFSFFIFPSNPSSPFRSLHVIREAIYARERKPILKKELKRTLAFSNFRIRRDVFQFAMSRVLKAFHSSVCR